MAIDGIYTGAGRCNVVIALKFLSPPNTDIRPGRFYRSDSRDRSTFNFDGCPQFDNVVFSCERVQLPYHISEAQTRVQSPS